MKTIKILWKRFWAATPKFLVKLRNLCLALAAMCGAALGIISQYDVDASYKGILINVLLISTSVAAGLQFSTSDKDVQQLSEKTI